jgi:hypothetical protein
MMKTIIWSVVAATSWTAVAEAAPKDIALTDVPAAEMTLAKSAVAGFIPSSAISDCVV